MIRSARGADAYRRTDVETRSPMELVIMLYDGALRFVGEAREAIDRKDVKARTDATRRALDIVTELQNTLNLEQGGDIALELDRLYSYVLAKLLEVTRGDAIAADEVLKLLGMLREGWSQAQTTTPAPAAARAR